MIMIIIIIIIKNPEIFTKNVNHHITQTINQTSIIKTY